MLLLAVINTLLSEVCMAITKKADSPFYYVRFTIRGKRFQESTKTSSRAEAERYENKRKQELTEELLYGIKPKKLWKEAVERWAEEMRHKRTILQDMQIFKYLDKYLKNHDLNSISNQVIENIALKKESIAGAASVNRMLALLRAVLNKASKQWEWIDRVPYIRMRKEPPGRIRYLDRIEAARLIKELPPHLVDMVKFTLAVGLRASNLVGLKWTDIDWTRQIAFIDASDFKNGRSYAAPLNKDAMDILNKLKNNNNIYVFLYNNKPIAKQPNTKAYKRALERARINDFTWHDLRHTWASWHVQQGTTLHELMEIGGWKSMTSVLRYAHLNRDNLITAANRIVESA